MVRITCVTSSVGMSDAEVDQTRNEVNHEVNHEVHHEVIHEVTHEVHYEVIHEVSRNIFSIFVVLVGVVVLCTTWFCTKDARSHHTSPCVRSVR